MSHKPPPKGDELRRLVLRAQAGDRQARNELVVRNMGLVAKPATYYAKRNPGIILDDLMQAGRTGLIRAVEKFDLEKGFKFSTYADWWIKQELRRLVRAENPRGVSARLKDTSDYMERRMSPEDEKLYEAGCLGYIALDSPAIAGDSSSDMVRDVIVGQTDMEEESHTAVLMEQVHKVMRSGRLSQFHREALMLHFGVGCEPHTVEQIRRQFASEGYDVDVHQLVDESLAEIRDSIGVRE